jgi:short-subunit dehydrogenase involved in D-alanine esterification of teichoic acids
MDLGLTGKTALITGGTSGIGLAIARRLGQEGCRIAICGRAADRLKTALTELSPDARGFAADVRQPSDIARPVADVTVYCCGHRQARPHRHRGQQCRHPSEGTAR